MAAIKLQAIGNSYGFRLPKEALKISGFSPDDQYEAFSEDGVIVIVKRLPHHSQWRFSSPKLNPEDRKWVNAK